MKSCLITSTKAFVLAFSLFGAGLAQAEPESQVEAKPETITPADLIEKDPRDPFENFNRAMWDLNYNYLDRYLYRPVARGYRDYVPDPVQTGIYNVVLNLEEPQSVVNNILQGKPKYAVNAAGRFVVNSTVGILGVIDVAGYVGMERKLDDFSEVMGYYGVPDGPYFMLPVVGPYVAREIAFDWVDGTYWPLSELNFWASAAKWGLKNLHKRAKALEQDGLIDNAIDPYLFVRDAYFQHVAFKVYDGEPPIDDDDDELLDDYLDELD
ncbi:MlaA family lipoprotein [Paraferrimonas sedimenticola]|uniref:ABC transporter n=1 Tax=Paraferrimonas sedimenticola TaxID=375674 RepID=A0AA37W050_9GAMM|nr:VacJ family lipoprotein [Paraferrimonas sedimenticola]GLP94948.1 ABC transporter [Paraferrimonas sedimenticola]